MNRKRIFWMPVTLVLLLLLAVFSQSIGLAPKPAQARTGTTVESMDATSAAGMIAASQEMTETGAVYDIVSAGQVPDIVAERDTPLSSVSPDGTLLTWIQSRRTGLFRSVGQVCFFALANSAKSCYDAPEELLGYPYQLYWAPDSSAITFTENPVDLGYDSDIWLINVADGSYVNLTDDGFTGSWITETEPQIDYLPMWSSSDGMIYFWRIVPLGDFQYTMGIYRVSPDGGEAEAVRDLSESLSGYIPLFDQDTLTMDSVSALSPDGSTIAVALYQVDQEQDVETTPNSVWLIDVTETITELQQIMTPEDLQAGLPSWIAAPGLPVGLSWTADGSAVVVDTFANDTHAPLHTYYYLDIASDESTPVVDFSTSPSYEALYAAEGDEIPLRYYSPWTASLAADGLSLLLYSDLGGTGSVMQAQFPPDGSLPAIVASADTPPLSGGTRSSRAEDGQVLMYGVLFQTEAQE